VASYSSRIISSPLFVLCSYCVFYVVALLANFMSVFVHCLIGCMLWSVLARF